MVSKAISLPDPKAAIAYYLAVRKTCACGHGKGAHGAMGCEGVQQDGHCACKAKVLA